MTHPLIRRLGSLSALNRQLAFFDDLVLDLEGVFDQLLGESQDLIDDTFGQHRRVWEEDGHAQIEVPGIEEPRRTALRKRLKRSLEQLDQVHWAEVNAITNRVAVSFDGDPSALRALVQVIEGVEDVHGVRRERVDERHRDAKWDASDRAEHPADVEPIHRTIAALAGDALGLGWSVLGRVSRLPSLPIEAAGLLSFADSQPWIRERFEQVVGRRVTDLVLPLTTAALNGAAQGPTGILVDMAHRALLLTELRARRAVWCRREPEFYANPRGKAVEPPDLEPRPVPLPKGPVEQWSDRISLASIAGFTAALAATRDPRRAADAFLAGMPKAAKLGREAFASQLGRTLAARGVVPLDASSLRRLDRVDTVVIDSAALVTGRARIGTVITLDDHSVEELRRRADELLDPEHAGGSQRVGLWMLTPFSELASAGSTNGDGEPDSAPALDQASPPLPRGAKARASELRRAGGRVLALLCDGQLVGLAAAVAELDPGTAVLVQAVRDAGHRLVIAGSRTSVARLVGADHTVPRGKKMGAAVRRLQAEGAVVAVVARRGKTGLSAADVGIGLTRRSGRPPWGADLLCGREVVEAAFIIEASAVAAEVSRRSAQLALLGSGLGAAVAMTGPRRGAGRRTLAMVNGAAAAALAAGTWSGVSLARRPRPVAPSSIAWHALPVERILEELDTDGGGLSSAEARHRRRSERRDEPDGGPLEPFLAELANPLTPVLGAGAGLSAAVGSFVDASMVGALIGVNTLVGGLQRLRTDRAVARLLERNANEVRVLRDGHERVVPEEGLVSGDVIALAAGDAVPADCRIIAASALEVDESSLTGESLPVAKSTDPTPAQTVADRSCMLFEDTTIAAGSATAVVVATGPQTETGRSLAIAGRHPPKSGVEVRLDELIHAIMPGAALAAGGVAAAGMLRRWSLRQIVGSAVSLAVASVPEGLPFVATAAQLASARRLSARDALVRNPRTIEALGRVDVLCFDKTGTLTEGRIRLQRVSDGADFSALDDLAATPLSAVLAAALRATPPSAAGNGANATDLAVLEGAAGTGVTAASHLDGWEPVAELPFEPGRGLYAVLGRCADGHRLSVKGAPEAVLPNCTGWRRAGRSEAFDRVACGRVEEEVERLARSGFRVLAVAERVASDRTQIDSERVRDLELHGLLALADPVRQSAAEAVSEVRRAGVQVVMITGDHPSTAEAIAAELGILTGHRVMTGAELEELDDRSLGKLVSEVSVFARVTPGQKVRIVQAFQAAGHAVAMTGDGANDAPSIRLADVGVALGDRGTPAARDAADLVVTDDRIETIIDAIVEGRALWGSVREALAILVGGNLGEIGFTVVASLLSPSPPMSARQLLLVNLLTDLAPAMAIAARPPAHRSPETLLAEGPESSLGAALTRDIAVRAVTTASGATGAWLAARLTGRARRASTVGLVALVGTQLGQTVLAGSGGRSPLVVATGLGSAAALAAIVQTPGLSQFFGCTPLGPVGWAQAGTAAGTATALSALGSWLLPGARPPA